MRSRGTSIGWKTFVSRSLLDADKSYVHVGLPGQLCWRSEPRCGKQHPLFSSLSCEAWRGETLPGTRCYMEFVLYFLFFLSYGFTSFVYGMRWGNVSHRSAEANVKCNLPEINCYWEAGVSRKHDYLFALSGIISRHNINICLISHYTFSIPLMLTSSFILSRQ